MPKPIILKADLVIQFGDEEAILPLTCNYVYRTDLMCNADVIIHPDTVNRIRVTCGSNLIGKIETEITDGILRIRNNNHCNWVRSFDPYIKVEVWTNDLIQIRTD